MTNYIYDDHGRPVGFWKDKGIFNSHGTAVGQLNGTHVYKLSGEYVGELDHDIVVDKHLRKRASIGTSGNTGNLGNAVDPGNRETRNFGLRSVWDKLIDDTDTKITT